MGLTTARLTLPRPKRSMADPDLPRTSGTVKAVRCGRAAYQFEVQLASKGLSSLAAVPTD